MHLNPWGQLGGLVRSPWFRGLFSGGPLGTPASGDLSNCTGQDWQLLAKATASSSATIDFTLTGWTNSDYMAYVVVLANVLPATDGAALYFRTSTNGGSTYDAGGSDYASAFNYFNFSASSTGYLSGGTAAQITMINIQGNVSNQEEAAGTLWLYRPSDAKRGKVTFDLQNYNATGDGFRFSGMGVRVAAADVNAIRFLYSSGNIASGEFRLYGMRNA